MEDFKKIPKKNHNMKTGDTRFFANLGELHKFAEDHHYKEGEFDVRLEDDGFLIEKVYNKEKMKQINLAIMIVVITAAVVYMVLNFIYEYNYL